MKFFKNVSVCLASLSIALLVGCLSVDEMLECKDPGIHRRGEEKAVEIITDPTSQSTEEEDFLGRCPIDACFSDMIIALFSKLSGCQDFSALNSQNWAGEFGMMV